MTAHNIETLERALLEYVAFYGLSIRAREIFGDQLPVTLLEEQRWAVERLQQLSEREEACVLRAVPDRPARARLRAIQ